MSVEGIRRRLDRLAESTAFARFASISSTLDRAHALQQQRRERGEPDPPFLLDPPPAADARRTDREAWRTIAHMQARATFLLAGRFDELRAAYDMSDTDLWRTLAGTDA